MDEKQNRLCPRCQAENQLRHNFCWLCGISLSGQNDETAALQRKQLAASAAASAGSGLVGILAGAMGGVVIGLMIVVAFIMTVLNAIGEFFESCAAMVMLMTLAFSAAIYSMASWLF